MEYRTLELNLISAKDLKDVNMFSKMDVYAVVSLHGDPIQIQSATTPIHKDGGKNPTWNFTAKFSVNESLAQQNRLSLEIKLISNRTLGDTVIGTVHVPMKELLDNPGDDKSSRQVSYQVRTPSGKAKGSFNFSYKFGERVAAPAASKVPAAAAAKQEPVMAYPPDAAAAGSSSAPSKTSETKQEPVMAYPPGVAAAVPYGTQYPPPPPQYAGGYGYPPQPAYGGYPPAQPGYGYPPQPGYGYPQQPGYGYPQVQQPPKKNKNKFGMGLGAGLLGGALGGMLIGDMVSDAAAYDAGYDAGFDDAGDFGGFDF